MRSLSKRFSFVSAVAAVAVAGFLGDVSAQKSTPASELDGGGRRPDEVGEERMTREEKIAWVEEQVAGAQQIFQRVEAMLAQAKKEKDSIKISCLQDKLTQLEVNMQGVEERRMLFDDALSAGDAGNAGQQFTILRIYIARVKSLMAEAENCVGEGDVVIGDADTSMTIDDDITDEDPTEPVDWQVGADQPVHASGYF